LTDGSLLYDSGTYPLNHVICGGLQLHGGDDYTIVLVTHEQVKDVNTAISELTELWFRERYFSLLKADEYEYEIGDDDFRYIWNWFQGVRGLFGKAAVSGRAVIFTVDA
jgi:hypothetical protein